METHQVERCEFCGRPLAIGVCTSCERDRREGERFVADHGMPAAIEISPSRPKLKFLWVDQYPPPYFWLGAKAETEFRHVDRLIPARYGANPVSFGPWYDLAAPRG